MWLFVDDTKHGFEQEFELGWVFDSENERQFWEHGSNQVALLECKNQILRVDRTQMDHLMEVIRDESQFHPLNSCDAHLGH